MGVRFLSDEYMRIATETMNAHEGFSDAIGDVDLGMQFIVTDVPDGEDDLTYYISIEDGEGVMARGELEAPDATIKHSYETAARISTGDLNSTMAFMTGKLKASGNLAKLMVHQGALNQIQDAMEGVDVEY